MGDNKKLSIICRYCESAYTLRYDEVFDKPEFCPFCAESVELGDDDEDLSDEEDDEF